MCDVAKCAHSEQFVVTAIGVAFGLKCTRQLILAGASFVPKNEFKSERCQRRALF
jgi:hypothetical protein